MKITIRTCTATLLCLIGSLLLSGLSRVHAEGLTPPASAITSPAGGSMLKGSGVIITGTATDDSGVQQVEVSTDGGETWNTPGVWQAFPLDNTGGNDTSVAVDSAGKVHIGYINSSNIPTYATNASGTWQTEAIDGASGLNSISIALDAAGKAHLSYSASYSGTIGLKYATNASGSWVVSTVAGGANAGSCSIALDSAGKAHISYTTPKPGWGGYGILKYATNTTGSWQTYTVDDSPSYPAGTGGIRDTSIALDSSGNAHIGYFDQTSYTLRYATNSGGTWQYEIAGSGGVGMYCSITVDASGKAHIASAGFPVHPLKYTTNETGSWQTSTVDAGHDVGTTSIAIDASGHLHVGYGGSGGTKFADNTSGSWQVQPVDNIGGNASLALDSGGKAHITYGSASGLRYATDAAAWPYWSYTWTLPTDGVYTLISRATDNDLNVETPGAGVSVIVDNTLPFVTMAAPADGSVLVGTTDNVIGVAFDSGSGVALVEVSTDMGLKWYGATDISGDGTWSSWNYSWSLPSDGVYYIRSRVTDMAGNLKYSANFITVRVDNNPPSSAVTAPSAGYAMPEALSSFSITGTATDGYGTGVTGVEVSTDGGASWTAATDESGNSSWSSWRYDWLDPVRGSYTIVSRATDGNGHTEATGTGLSATVDNHTPAITSSPVLTATEDEPYAYDADATDHDGDTLSFALVEMPAGMTIAASTGVVSWTPANGQAGGNPVSIKVMDGYGGTAYQNFTVTVEDVNYAPTVSSIEPSSGTYSDGMLYLQAAASDPDSGDTVTSIGYGYSTDGGVTWTAIAEDDTPEDPYHWESGLDNVEVLLRARASDGSDWGQWLTASGTILVVNTAPVLMEPLNGTVRPAAYLSPPTPPRFAWDPNICASFLVYFASSPSAPRPVRLPSDNGGYGSTFTPDTRKWNKITRIGRDIWWWVVGTTVDGIRYTSDANLLTLDGGFGEISEIPATDVQSIPTMTCDPGPNVMTGLELCSNGLFVKPARYPSRPLAVTGSTASHTPSVRAWSKAIKYGPVLSWRFRGGLPTGETTYSDVMETIVTGGPEITSHAGGASVTAPTALVWDSDPRFVSYQVSVVWSDNKPNMASLLLGSTSGNSYALDESKLTLLRQTGNEVRIRVTGITPEKLRAHGPSVLMVVSGTE